MNEEKLPRWIVKDGVRLKRTLLLDGTITYETLDWLKTDRRPQNNPQQNPLPELMVHQFEQRPSTSRQKALMEITIGQLRRDLV